MYMHIYEGHLTDSGGKKFIAGILCRGHISNYVDLGKCCQPPSRTLYKTGPYNGYDYLPPLLFSQIKSELVISDITTS